MKTRIEKCAYTPCGLLLPLLLLFLLTPSPLAQAQVNSGSDGHDGAFNPTATTVINMADHPDGIYHYTEVNIPDGVTVSFIPNAANTPVVWLVQSNCVIGGVLNVDGAGPAYTDNGGVWTPGVQGAPGGPGGYRGGNGGGGGVPAGDGTGPGGGHADAGSGSFASAGQRNPGTVYGNIYLVPLVGGSGGAGATPIYGGIGGGGGGGAILIAASGTIEIRAGTGAIFCEGGIGANNNYDYSGGGSGGGVRLAATTLRGAGTLLVRGGGVMTGGMGGSGRIRLDALENYYTGTVYGEITRGFQPIIIPPPNQTVSLAIQSVAGFAVLQNPTGVSLTPDVVVPGAAQNPVPIVVHCGNIPLNTDIIVEVKPANGPTIRTVGANSAGTQASSTATVSVTMPRGAGTIQAKCVSGLAGSLGASLNNGKKFMNYAETGLTADGEVFAKMEITATLGHGQEIAFITESGKRYSLPSR